MNRREFIGLIGAAGTASAWNPVSAAVEPRRIGLIGPGSSQASQQLPDAFRAGLSALGWADGANVIILDRWSDDYSERLPRLAKELIASDVEILVTAGTAATRAAATATTKIPIVMVGIGDPLTIRGISSLERPGGNTTGLSLTSSAVAAERLQLLKELLPDLRRVAIIIRQEPGLEQRLSDIRSSADRMGLQHFAFEMTTGITVRLTFIHLQNDRCEALYLASGPMGPAKRAEIINRAATARLPAIYSFGEFTAGGGLMSFAADTSDLFRRAASFVDRILKGAKPADLPVEPPTKFKLVVNLKTANTLGLTVPPSLLARADEVIE